MNNKTALTGTVLLEAYWATRKKDMLDLIAPFIQYCVAKTTALDEIIDIAKVTGIIRNEFGYIDIPEAAIVKVLNRDQDHFKRINKYYFRDEDEKMALSSIENRSTTSINRDLEIVKEELMANDIDKILYYDLTRPELGVSVVRVIIPEMELFALDPSRAGYRFLKV